MSVLKINMKPNAVSNINPFLRISMTVR
ncbi:protein of unknown function [Latilactobacillus sakei]|nr:hypothetical protein LSAJ18_70028 [Latilactobacillus sakei]SON66621.1 protein of unknown function [Latilactobacillus sakei]